MSKRYEKCDFADATHVMLADGETVRKIAARNGNSARLVNHTFPISIFGMTELGATFVREIDDTPEPWEGQTVTLIMAFMSDASGKKPVAILPERFRGQRVRVEVVK